MGLGRIGGPEIGIHSINVGMSVMFERGVEASFFFFFSAASNFDRVMQKVIARETYDSVPRV